MTIYKFGTGTSTHLHIAKERFPSEAICGRRLSTLTGRYKPGENKLCSNCAAIEKKAGST